MTPEEIAAAAQQTPAAPIVPSAEMIANAVTAGLAAHQQSVASAPKEMTAEERNAYLQVFDPNADGFLDSFVSAITDAEATPDTRAKAIAHLRDGITNQSLRGAELLIDQRVNQLEQRLAPALAYTEKTQMDDIWNAFAAKHEDLKDQRQLVDMVSAQISKSGYKPANLDDAFDRAAEATRELIGKVTGKPYVKPVATQQGPTRMPAMTPTSVTPSAQTPAPTDSQPAVGAASFFLKRKR